MKLGVLGAFALVAIPAVPLAAQERGEPNSLGAILEENVGTALEDPEEAFERAEAVIDIAKCWTGSSPAVRTQIQYSNTCRFDKLLNVALKSERDQVTVEVGRRFGPDSMTERMSSWIRKVEKKGEVRYCRDTASTRGIFEILSVLWSIFKAWKRYDTYRPAKNYNAVVVYSENNTQTGYEQSVERIVFNRKPLSNTCPEGTINVDPS